MNETRTADSLTSEERSRSKIRWSVSSPLTSKAAQGEYSLIRLAERVSDGSIKQWSAIVAGRRTLVDHGTVYSRTRGNAYPCCVESNSV